MYLQDENEWKTFAELYGHEHVNVEQADERQLKIKNRLSHLILNLNGLREMTSRDSFHQAIDNYLLNNTIYPS